MDDKMARIVDSISRKIKIYANTKPTTSAEWIHVRAKYEAFVEVLKIIEKAENESETDN